MRKLIFLSFLSILTIFASEYELEMNRGIFSYYFGYDSSESQYVTNLKGKIFKSEYIDVAIEMGFFDTEHRSDIGLVFEKEFFEILAVGLEFGNSYVNKEALGMVGLRIGYIMPFTMSVFSINYLYREYGYGNPYSKSILSLGIRF